MMRLESLIKKSKNFVRKEIFVASVILATTILTGGCSWDYHRINKNSKNHSWESYVESEVRRSSLVLKSDEFVVPRDTLKVFTFVIKKDLDIEEYWKYPAIGFKGFYVNYNHMPGHPFDFLERIYSKKERFFDLCSKYTSFTKEEIKSYYKILTTPRNIVVEKDFSMNLLFHERTHKYIYEELKPDEIDVLKKASKEFSSWIYEKKFVNEEMSLKVSEFFGKKTIIYEAFAQKYIKDQCIAVAINLQNWQELYAYLAEDQIYSQDNIQPEVYTALSKRHPEAFSIYNKIIKNLLQEK